MGGLVCYISCISICGIGIIFYGYWYNFHFMVVFVMNYEALTYIFYYNKSRAVLLPLGGSFNAVAIHLTFHLE